MMHWWSSLTVRLVVASLAWTTGLLYVAHLISVTVMFGPTDLLQRFGHRVGPTLLLAIAIMILGAWIVRDALRSFTGLRQRLRDVQSGRERLVTGYYLREVQPVVSALNDLLEHQEQRMRDAMAKAGDLAHGLKTPLAVLGSEAERAAADGHHDLAVTLWQQIERMRRHIDYHLAHARAAAAGNVPGARCAVADSADAIARTLMRLHAQRGLSLIVNVASSHVVRAQREDVDEMIGNLLDNACKWARSQVIVTSADAADRIVIAVEDDGPGIVEEMREQVLQRGVRADEAAPGSGLGLAIVRDLAELYGGGITLGRSSMGGLQAELRLPRQAAEYSADVKVG
jgi:signal transduction histidine kinase